MTIDGLLKNPALPVTIVGGYLGAGKTTLINHLLRTANGRRLAILVNEFGRMSIDTDLIESHDGEVINLAGGCICCSFGNDLMGALLRLREQLPLLDHVLIETSGVSLPGSVASTIGLVQPLRVNAVVVLADAAAVRRQASDRYVGATVISQLQQADVLILNKLDMLGSGDKSALYAWGASCWADAQIVETTQCELPAGLIFDIAEPDIAQREDGRGHDERVGAGPAEKAGFRSKSFLLPIAVDLQTLSSALVSHGNVIARAKGLLRDSAGALQLFQFSGGHCAIAPWRGKAFSFGRLVCIGAAATWKEDVVQDIVQQSLVPQIIHSKILPLKP